MATRDFATKWAPVLSRRLTRRTFGVAALGALASVVAMRGAASPAQPPAHVYQAPQVGIGAPDAPCACPVCSGLTSERTGQA